MHTRWWLVAAIYLLSARAYAGSLEAQALFDEGNKLLAAGKVAEACRAFETSNELEPRAGTLIRLGECREENHQLATAWEAYKDALTRVKDPNKRAVAQAKVAAVEARLSYLTVSVALGARVDELAITRNGKPLVSGLWNHALPADGGEYVIAVSAPHRGDWSTTVRVPDENGNVVVEVPILKQQRSEPADVAPAPAPVTEQPEESEREVAPSPTLTPRRKIALGVGGAALAFAGVGIVLAVQAQNRADAAYELCPDPAMACSNAAAANALVEENHTRSTASAISFGLAGAAAIGAGVLWFTGAPHRGSSVAVVPSGFGGLAVAGRF